MIVVEGLEGRHSETHADVAAEIVLGEDDAGLDQHLADRNIQPLDKRPDVGQGLAGVLDQQGIGALVDRDPSAFGQQGIGAGQELGDIGGLGIVDLNELRAQRRQLLDLLTGLELHLLTRCQLLGRGHEDHVADLACRQAAALEDDIESLIPGDVLQPQGDGAADAVGDDHVAPGDLGEDLQHRPGFHVLEVQGDGRAGVYRLLRFGALALDRLAKFERHALIGLIGELLVGAAGGDGQFGIIALLSGDDLLHRCREVEDVVALPQGLRYQGVAQGHHRVVALSLDVHRGVWVAQVYDHLALTPIAATKVDIRHLHRALRLRRIGLACLVLCLPYGGRCLGGGPEADDDLIALRARGVGHQACQLDDHPRPVAGLRGADPFGEPDADLPRSLTQGKRGVRQVERDARGVVDGEADGLGCFAAQLEDHVDAVAGTGDEVDVRKPVLLALGPAGRQCQRQKE